MYDSEVAAGLSRLLQTPHIPIESPEIARLLLKNAGLTYANLKWSKEENHAVHVTHIEGGRVFFRNPHGPSNGKTGELIHDDGPPRRLEDPATGLESMPEDDFSNALAGGVIPLSKFLNPELALLLCRSSGGRTALSEFVSDSALQPLLVGVEEAGKRLSKEERAQLQNSINANPGASYSVSTLIALYASAPEINQPKVRKEFVKLASSGDLRMAKHGLDLLHKYSSDFSSDLTLVAKAAARDGDKARFGLVVSCLNKYPQETLTRAERAEIGLIGLTSPDKSVRYEALFSLKHDSPYFAELFRHVQPEDALWLRYEHLLRRSLFVWKVLLLLDRYRFADTNQRN